MKSWFESTTISSRKLFKKLRLLQKRIYLELEQIMLPIGLYQTVHGVSSQVVDGFQELSFMVTPFMVSEVTRLFIQQVFMGVPGPKSPLVPLLIWLTGMDDCMVLV